MYFTNADNFTGRGISFDTACQCNFDQFCCLFRLKESGNDPQYFNNLFVVSKIYHIGRECKCWSFMRQLKLCGPNSSPNKCTLNKFSGISSAGSCFCTHEKCGINLFQFLVCLQSVKPKVLLNKKVVPLYFGFLFIGK